MKQNKTVLTTTGEEVFPVPFTGMKGAVCPWSNKHERVLFKYPNGTARCQVVRKSKLKQVVV